MLKTFIIISGLLFVLQTNFFAQSKKDNFQKQKDSLLILKTTLQNNNAKLKAEIKILQAKFDKISDRYNKRKILLFTKRYGKKIGAQVAAGRIWKGMTEKMMRDSWGKPDKIHTNKEKWGVFSQWTYGKITYFFRDGKLTDKEEKK